MSDNVTEKTPSQALSTEVAEMIPGKEIGGHPFFEANLPRLIASEARHEHPKASQEEIKAMVQRQLEAGGYDKVIVPSYAVNNGVYLLIEPEDNSEDTTDLQSQKEVIDIGEPSSKPTPSSEKPIDQSQQSYKAYTTAFPSEEQFQALQASNPDLARFSSLHEYRNYIVSLFALPPGEKYSLLETEGKYQPADLFVPLSQHYKAGSKIQTPLSKMVDHMIENLSSPL